MWRKKQAEDFFYKKAQKDGFRSRAAYKLLEIQDKFKIIKTNSSVLDLGCAPGGWLQVAKQLTKNFICGIDIQPIQPLLGVHFGQFDCFNKEKTSEFFARINAPERFNVILSDMSPNISGDKLRDHVASIELLNLFFSICEGRLAKNGIGVVKVFEGKYLSEAVCSQKAKICRFKPKSSRLESSEMYLILIL